MEASLFDGELIRMDDGRNGFAAALIEVENPRGGVILLHGRGFHADWESVVGPLRVALADAGWSTLSIQLPVLAKGRKYYDYVAIFPQAHPRIEAAIAYMRDNVPGPVALLAHSCGVHMSMHWIEEHGDSAIDAYIGVGMGATDYGQDLVRPFPLARMKAPILDVLGTAEYPRVLALAKRRKTLLETTAERQSRQVFVEGADHYFKGRDAELARVVADWLNGLEP